MTDVKEYRRRADELERENEALRADRDGLHREWRVECDLRQDAQRIASERDAEVVTLRAKVAAVEAVEDSWSGRILPSSAWPHVHHWLRDLRAALATTGEAQ